MTDAGLTVLLLSAIVVIQSVFGILLQRSVYNSAERIIAAINKLEKDRP